MDSNAIISKKHYDYFTVLSYLCDIIHYQLSIVNSWTINGLSTSNNIDISQKVASKRATLSFALRSKEPGCTPYPLSV